MSEPHCPLCGHHLPDDAAPSVVKQLVSKPLSDSTKYLAFLNFMDRHKAQFPDDTARLAYGKDGQVLADHPGHFFLKSAGHVDLFIKDAFFLDGSELIIKEMESIPRLDAVWINSVGGSLACARRVAESLRGKTPVCYIHVLCASSAVLVAMAADRILIDKNARMACHPAIGAVMGNSLQLRNVADVLDEATASIMAEMQKRTGKSMDEIRGFFNPEQDRYFSAPEAVECGLADGYAPTFEGLT